MKRAALVALGVVGVSVTAVLVLGDRYQIAPPASLDTTTWHVYADPEVGWSLRYPDGWRVQEDEHACPPHAQIVITNVGADLRHPELPAPPGGFACTDRWDMRELPDGFVVVELEEPGDVAPGRRGSQLTVPLSLHEAHPGHRTARYEVPRGIAFAVFLDRNHTYYVRAWFGPGASAHDRRIADQIVASIRFDVE